MRKLSILSHLRAQEHNAAKPTDDDHGEAAADSDEDEAIMFAAGAQPTHSRDATARRQRGDSVERVVEPEGSLAGPASAGHGASGGDGMSGDNRVAGPERASGGGGTSDDDGVAAPERVDGGGPASPSSITTRSPPPQPPPPLGVRSDYEWTTRAARTDDNNPFILNPYHLSRDASAPTRSPAPESRSDSDSDSRVLAAEAAAAAAEAADCCSICLGPKRHPVVLPSCSHSFCRLCLAEVREKCMPGTADACPLCRAPLPEGPNRAYDEAILCWIKIDHAAKRGEVDWSALPTELQREWSRHLHNLQEAADTACHSLSCHWLGYCYHKVGSQSNC